MTITTIMITGGGGKFGRQYIDCFLKQGKRVVFTAKTQKSIDTTLDYFQHHKNLSALAVDFLDGEFSKKVIDYLVSHKIMIEALINNARSIDALRINEQGLTDRQQFIDEYLVDVVSPYELTMALALQKHSMLKKVVNISSQYSLVVANPALYNDYAHQSPIQYGVAKAALNSLTKELAVRLAHKNIQVNAVAYGGVAGRVDAAFKARYAQLTPQGRMLAEEDIAGPVNFLLAEDSAAITGQIIQVDGGWTLW